MKKINLLTGLIATSLLLFFATGCKKDNDSSGGSGVGATINGAGFQSQTLWTYAEHSGGTINIFGGYIKSGDSSAFYIGFYDSVNVGVADNFELSGIEYIRSTSSGAKAYSSDISHSHGSVTLTTYDVNGKRVAGTFDGVLYNEDQSNDSVKIENGHFNLSYTGD